MAQYDRDGRMVKIIENLKSGKYLVNKFFTGEAEKWDDECDFSGEELFIVDEIFSTPPTEKLEEKFVNLQKNIADLYETKRKLEQDIRDTEKEGKARIAKYKKYEQLKNLDLFLDGKITHYVLEYWGSFKIIAFEDAIPDERYDKDQTKLLTLFGRSGGDLQWGLSKYSDGSGNSTTVTPCVSYKEALEVAQRIVDRAMGNNYQCPRLIGNAKKYNLKVAPEYIGKYEEKEKAKKNKAIKELEEKLEKLRNQKDEN